MRFADDRPSRAEAVLDMADPVYGPVQCPCCGEGEADDLFVMMDGELVAGAPCEAVDECGYCGEALSPETVRERA